jgi:hypothetical protein
MAGAVLGGRDTWRARAVVPSAGAVDTAAQILKDCLQTDSRRKSYTCSNRGVGVRRPAWWCYPERCQNGHEWGPGLITVSWVLCDCPPAQAVRERVGGGPAGHMAVFCNPTFISVAGFRGL